MENKPSDLRESLWRRKPSATESNELRTQPGLELEARLTDALAKLADAPVASNFTSRLLAEIDREEARIPHSHWRWNWNFLRPRLAVAVAVVFFAGLGIRHYEIESHRTALARNVALVAVAHPLPSVDALENLDAIAAVEGVDGVFIGPADLSAALGHLGKPGHPDVQQAIENAIARIRASGRAAGILTIDEAQARRYLSLGCTFVAVGLDGNLLMRTTGELAARFK